MVTIETVVMHAVRAVSLFVAINVQRVFISVASKSDFTPFLQTYCPEENNHLNQYLIFSPFCSDPPLSEEDIPSGLWLCHMCQMLQKQRASNANKIPANDDDITQNEMQRIKDSRPSTPITIDGVINAAKLRLNHKRSLSRVSSSSDNSSSSDRELKVKLTRIDSILCSSNSEVLETPTPKALDPLDRSNNRNSVKITETSENNAQDTENVDVRNDVIDVEQQLNEPSEMVQQSGENQSIECLIEEISNPSENTPEEEKKQEINENSSEEMIEMVKIMEINESQNSKEETNAIDEEPFKEKMETDEVAAVSPKKTSVESPKETSEQTLEETVEGSNEILPTEADENNGKLSETVDAQNKESHVAIQPQIENQSQVDTAETTAIGIDCEINIDENEEKANETIDEHTTDFKSPFEELIRAASILNPRQFELPRELTICPKFPGDEKG